jgi:hypothetical protein
MGMKYVRIATDMDHHFKTLMVLTVARNVVVMDW